MRLFKKNQLHFKDTKRYYYVVDFKNAKRKSHWLNLFALFKRT